jgi:hypothetical protein
MKLLETYETNKRNCAKVKYHQSIGSRSYVVQLQIFVSDGYVFIVTLTFV